MGSTALERVQNRMRPKVFKTSTRCASWSKQAVWFLRQEKEAATDQRTESFAEPNQLWCIVRLHPMRNLIGAVHPIHSDRQNSATNEHIIHSDRQQSSARNEQKRSSRGSRLVHFGFRSGAMLTKSIKQQCATQDLKNKKITPASLKPLGINELLFSYCEQPLFSRNSSRTGN